MIAQSEQINLQVNAARLARTNAQRMRLLAAARAEKLERELKDAAEAGLRTEISRGIVARDRLRALANRKRAARYAGIAAFGMVLCAATLGMGWAPAQNAAVHVAASPAPVLNAEPGDPLRLALRRASLERFPATVCSPWNNSPGYRLQMPSAFLDRPVKPV